MKTIIFFLLFSLTFSQNFITLKTYTGHPFSFKIKNGESLKDAPIGMSLNKRTGIITWQPGYSQNGIFKFEVVSQDKNISGITLTSIKKDKNPKGIYVVLNSEINGNGKIETPYNNLENIIAKPGDTIYLRGGQYFKDSKITFKGKKNNPIKITRLPGEKVLINFKSKAFNITPKSSYLIIDGLEIDGMAQNNHYDMLKNKWWHKNYFALYYDVDDKWANTFGYKIFQLVLPNEFVVVHKKEYPLIDPKDLPIQNKVQYQGKKN